MELAKNCATTNDNDAIDADIARARPVTPSSHPGSPGPGLCTTPFILRATQRQRCCHDGGVLPYMIRICLQPLKQNSWLLSLEQWQLLAPLVPLVPLIPRPSGRVLAVVAAVVICQWFHDMRLWLAVAGLGFCIWRVRLLGCASWKQFSRLQKAFCFCEKLTLLHLVPIDEAPASSSMLRAV